MSPQNQELRPLLNGLIEIMSPIFAMGWARSHNGHPARVYAMLDTQIIGWAVADSVRGDLKPAPSPDDQGSGADDKVPQGFGYTIIFDNEVSIEQLDEVKIFVTSQPDELRRGKLAGNYRREPRQIFVLGSPRSGTSQLAETLAHTLSLPWFGECHAAPAFQAAALALSGRRDPNVPLNGLLRYMVNHNFRDRAIQAMREAYFCAHRSPSFLDKTPGSPMIAAAPFIQEAFPSANFVFVRRNGIANVMSRLVKFGGEFRNHCADWAGAISNWKKVKGDLTHYVEIDQEAMLDDPENVARSLASYLNLESTSEIALAESLRTGSRERTGAGIGRTTLESTGWSPAQVKQFREICGPMMAECNYPLD
jgi:hypothetical protein